MNPLRRNDLTLADLPFANILKANPKAALFAEKLSGAKVADSDIRECCGALLENGVALVSMSDDDAYQVLIRFGSTWRIAVAAIARHDPVILAKRESFVRIPNPDKEALTRHRAQQAAALQAAQEQAKREDAERQRRHREKVECQAKVEAVEYALRRSTGEDLARARAQARELGIEAPLGAAL